jgi:hypothetical protein
VPATPVRGQPTPLASQPTDLPELIEEDGLDFEASEDAAEPDEIEAEPDADGDFDADS